MIILLGDTWTCTVHMYCIYSIHTGLGKIMETPDNIGIKLPVLAALNEHQLWISFIILLFVYTK